MHVLVKALHDVRDRVNVRDLRLRAEEFSEFFEIRQILGFANAARIDCRYGIFDRVHAKVLQRPVGVGAELDTLAEVFDPLIVKVDRWDESDQQRRRGANTGQQLPAIYNNHIRQPVHRSL